MVCLGRGKAAVHLGRLVDSAPSPAVTSTAWPLATLEVRERAVGPQKVEGVA
jgi:hypothetical protein